MLRWIAGIKSILWILAILRGVYGVMGPHLVVSGTLILGFEPIVNSV